MSGAVFAGTADLSVWNRAVAAGITGTNRAAKEWLGASSTGANGLPGARLPEAVGAVMTGAGQPWASLAPVLLVPQHQVTLPGGSMPAHGDLLCVARHDTGLMTLAVEGKADEGFGADIAKWQREAASGRKTRLAYLAELLGIALPLPDDLRYQFLARMASAIIEAERFHAGAATLLVHSFSSGETQSRQNTGFDDFARFVQIMGATDPATVNVPVALGIRGRIERYALWVGGTPPNPAI